MRYWGWSEDEMVVGGGGGGERLWWSGEGLGEGIRAGKLVCLGKG